VEEGERESKGGIGGGGDGMGGGGKLSFLVS